MAGNLIPVFGPGKATVLDCRALADIPRYQSLVEETFATTNRITFDPETKKPSLESDVLCSAEKGAHTFAVSAAAEAEPNRLLRAAIMNFDLGLRAMRIPPEVVNSFELGRPYGSYNHELTGYSTQHAHADGHAVRGDEDVHLVLNAGICLGSATGETVIGPIFIPTLEGRDTFTLNDDGTFSQHSPWDIYSNFGQLPADIKESAMSIDALDMFFFDAFSVHMPSALGLDGRLYVRASASIKFSVAGQPELARRFLVDIGNGQFALPYRSVGPGGAHPVPVDSLYANGTELATPTPPGFSILAADTNRSVRTSPPSSSGATPERPDAQRSTRPLVARPANTTAPA